ncbi:ABC transporter substrate-binding protein [Paraburkholderia sp. EG287A]|uniref:ABC transporter substrate-binding protein n=1 Tax=unclassified Paraburkholderia TaxID=2615204 RepID=UPI0034D2E4B7
MNRREFIAGCAAAPLAVGLGSSRAFAKDAGTVTVASWGGTFQDAQREALFKPFEKQTGIKVIEATGPSLAKVRAMVMSGSVDWDVIEAVPGDMLTMSESNLLEKVDYSALNKEVMSELLPGSMHPYGVATISYSYVIAYNTKKFTKEHHPRSWAEVWDAKTFPGSRILPAGSYVVRPNELALLADGVSTDKLYPLDLERSYRSLSKIRPSVLKWATSGTMVPQSLVSGEADIGFASQGRIVQLKEQGAPVDYDFNQGELTADFWTIPKGAKNRENALKFIEFASRAEPLAALCRAVPYGPPNRRSLDLLPAEIARQLPTHPDNLKLQFKLNAEWWAQRSQGRTNLERNTDMWNNWIRQ